MGKWKVYKQPIGTGIMYSVLRIIDENQPMHSGNVESHGCFATRQEAQKMADRLNSTGKEGKDVTGNQGE